MEWIFFWVALPNRNGIIASKYRWPNKTVPYQMSSNHTEAQQNYIKLGLRTIEAVSCVKFVRRTNEANFVNMTVSNRKHLFECQSNLVSL